MSTDRNARDLLQRLLGAPGPELTCEECFEQLDRYVEVEVEHGAPRAGELVPGMRAHLEGCRACAEEHDSLLALVRRET
jgi:hypothetical protein